MNETTSDRRTVMYWMIHNTTSDNEYWTDTEPGGWVEVEDGDVYGDDQKDGMRMPIGGEWVEACDCDGCGELMPCDTGEGRTAPFTRQSIDPPETVWICEVCVGNREAAEETRAEALREQYYELK